MSIPKPNKFIVVIAALSAFAGVLLSFSTVGPGAHDFWQMICALIIYPTVLIVDKLFGATINDSIFLVAGIVQSLWLSIFGILWELRRKKDRHSR
jgi:hypothetical protein